MVSLSVLFAITRPWAFPVSVCAIAVGGSLAYVDSPATFSWLHFLFSMLGGLSVHAAANLINTYGDYKSGVDVKGSADDRALVDGVVTAATVYRMIVACLGVAMAMFMIIVYTMAERPTLVTELS